MSNPGEVVLYHVCDGCYKHDERQGNDAALFDACFNFEKFICAVRTVAFVFAEKSENPVNFSGHPKVVRVFKSSSLRTVKGLGQIDKCHIERLMAW